MISFRLGKISTIPQESSHRNFFNLYGIHKTMVQKNFTYTF